MESPTRPFVTTGYLGWGNQAGPANRKSPLQLWGPGGRWLLPMGDYIEDHLEKDHGAGEGDQFIMIVRPRYSVSDGEWDRIQAAAKELLDE